MACNQAAKMLSLPVMPSMSKWGSSQTASSAQVLPQMSASR